jgi:hypothetical protein
MAIHIFFAVEQSALLAWKKYLGVEENRQIGSLQIEKTAIGLFVDVLAESKTLSETWSKDTKLRWTLMHVFAVSAVDQKDMTLVELDEAAEKFQNFLADFVKTQKVVEILGPWNAKEFTNIAKDLFAKNQIDLAGATITRPDQTTRTISKEPALLRLSQDMLPSVVWGESPQINDAPVKGLSEEKPIEEAIARTAEEATEIKTDQKKGV